MITLEYKLGFATPAFLGDASQNGVWRTPPFKALLRQWWRIVYCRAYPQASVAQLRQAESTLFGSASGRSGERSRIRLRLNGWQPGTLQRAAWKPLQRFLHEEAARGGRQISADSYLGYGPIVGGSSLLKSERAIDASEHKVLSIGITPRGLAAAPIEEASRQLVEALALIDLYGAVGGRSRNGWGSVWLSSTPSNGSAPARLPLANWRDLLRIDWPSAIGADETGPLIWATEPAPDWKAVMYTLATVRYRIRRNFTLQGLPSPHRQPADRHWLAYPLTNHKVESWERSKGGAPRLPNSLRFKVRRHSDGFVGVVFHMPVKPEESIFRPSHPTLLQVWSSVHNILDGRAPGAGPLGLCRAQR
jgi:CRISPR-associated protein Cmr1